MQQWTRAALYWVAGGFWWLFDRLYGDALFEKLRPMIPDWANKLSLDIVLDWIISYGPTIGLAAMGAYFLWKHHPNNRESTSSLPHGWRDTARATIAAVWTHPGVLGVLAAVVAGWTFVSESWLPVALVAGVGAFVALSFLPAAIRQGSRGLSMAVPAGAEAQTGAEKIEINRANDRVRRLNRALDCIVSLEIQRILRTVLKELMKEQPDYGYDEDISTNNDLMKQRTEVLESYLRLVQGELKDTQWGHNLDVLIHSVEAEENRRLEAEPPPANINAYIYRGYAVAMTKRRRVVDYLKSSHDIAEHNEMQHLSNLRVHAQDLDPRTFGV